MEPTTPSAWRRSWRGDWAGARSVKRRRSTATAPVSPRTSPGGEGDGRGTFRCGDRRDARSRSPGAAWPEVKVRVLDVLESALPAGRVGRGDAERRAHAHDYWAFEAIHDVAGNPVDPPPAVVYPESTAEVAKVLE